MRGADALVATLAEAGVPQLFTLSGNHVMSVFDATIGRGVELIHTRHEAATVHMADAWARLTGEVGIALVTGGPGHANAISALYTAAMSESPVVLLSGHAPLGQLGQGAFQEMAQADMAAPVTKASWTCQGAANVVADLARAMRIARSGRPGPVHLSLPSDVLESTIGAGASQSGADPAAGSTGQEASLPPAATLSNADAQALLARLRRAARPLVLVGPASLTRRAHAACRELEAAIGVPVVGMQSPRGINDPVLGAFATMLAAADCVLLVGKRLDFTLGFGRAPAWQEGCEILQVDPEALERERARRLIGGRLAASLEGDAPATIAALHAAAQRDGAPASHGAWRDEVAAAIAYRPAAWDQARAAIAGRLHPVQLCRALQPLLDSHPEAVLVCDGGEIGQWAQACLRAPDLVINGSAGAIGVAVPFAIAARLARPHAPVVAVMGDGAAGFHLTEYDTAMRYGLPFVGVIGNDARWNAEYQIQLKSYGADRAIGCDLRPARYDAVVTALGGFGERIEGDGADDAAVTAAVARAHASGLPACVDVMIEGMAAPVVRPVVPR
jgi:acetolactate synthase-1/2/3 large subunit